MGRESFLYGTFTASCLATWSKAKLRTAIAAGRSASAKDELDFHSSPSLKRRCRLTLRTVRLDKSIYTREYETLVRLLREAREEASLTQVDLAERLEQSQSFVSKCERGERRLDLIQLRTICQVLGISLTDFVRRLERELGAES